MRKKQIFAAALTAALLCGLAGCGTAEGGIAERGKSGAQTSSAASAAQTTRTFEHGTAGSLEGTTAVMTIFTDCPACSWDFSSEADRETAENIRTYLGIAADYLEETAASYGKSATFLTDFQEHSDLRLEASIDDDITNQKVVDYGLDTDVFRFLDGAVDIDSVMDEYGADNLIFLMVFNTDETCDSAITCTRCWYEGISRPYEVVYLFNSYEGEPECPAVYAHELLHTFGVPDYYTTDEEYGLDADDVSYLGENLPNEIMNVTWDITTGEYDYEKITNEVSEMTAYYAGLTDASETAEKLGLGPSEHVSG